MRKKGIIRKDLSTSKRYLHHNGEWNDVCIGMIDFAGKEVTIVDDLVDGYYIEEDDEFFGWTHEMFVEGSIRDTSE